jgi:2,3-bisphosphoglycerate-independent phosphoglycerate mutase
VGHNALGSGQIFDQGAKLVAAALASGQLFSGDTWRALITYLRGSSGTLHLIGLLSDGNVHSHIQHLLDLLQGAFRAGIMRLRVHALLDGRDVPATSALVYVDQLEGELARLQAAGCDAAIASGGGRMLVTMDRYQADWPMVERGWHTHVHGAARRFPSARIAIETLRAESPGLSDQYIPPFVIAGEQPLGIFDGDGVIFFNFRGDRAIELSQAFETGAEFRHFERGRLPQVFFCGMMRYDGDLGVPGKFLVDPPRIDHTLSQFLVERDVRQFAIAETQKYGHITYFWNGNRSGMLDARLETYREIASDLLPFDQRPWMKSAETTDALLEALASGGYSFLRANYACGDMVGHTGNYDATLTAMCCLDLQLGRLLQGVARIGACALVTADHGNAEQMLELDERGQPRPGPDGTPQIRTSHSLNPVPCWLFDPQRRLGRGLINHPGSGHPGSGQPGSGQPGSGHPGSGLANVAATLAEMLGYQGDAHWLPSLLARP